MNTLHRRSCQLLALLALGIAGCQTVTGLDKLAADRAIDTADASAATAERGEDEPRSGRDAQGGTGSTPSGGSGGRAMVGSGGARSEGGSKATAGTGAQPFDEDAGAAHSEGDCATRISYGSAWIRPGNHTGDSFDRVSGIVTWDGSCKSDMSGNSFAELSNGWKPYFSGRNSCVMAIDLEGNCGTQPPCSTRVSYGADWNHPEGHSDAFDDIPGVITTNGECRADQDDSYVVLSNGWQPHFMGKDSCEISMRYSQCNGLFANPVVNMDCPDPSVIQNGDRYVMACTAESPQLSLRSSRDLVHWKIEGSIFTEATKPRWADRDFWSPVLHRVGTQYLAYFNARQLDGELAIGVATAPNLLGPYADRGAPLLRDSPGAIDPHVFEAADGARYLLWKHEGNTSGGVAAIKIQPLTSDGLGLTGAPTTILTNTEAWEGTHIHAPWLLQHDGDFYLFYSADDTSSDGTSIGVARATALLGPYAKSAAPSLVSAGDWAAPGMGTPIQTTDSDWFLVFHAWPKATLGSTPPGRHALLTRMAWSGDGWPSLLGAPSSLSQPLP